MLFFSVKFIQGSHTEGLTFRQTKGNQYALILG